MMGSLDKYTNVGQNSGDDSQICVKVIKDCVLVSNL